MKVKTVVLSARMKALAALVTKGNVVCDVGCDHGFVSIYLVQEEIAPKVYAMDVNKGPLLRAQEHIEEYELSHKIETRLSDGLKALNPGEAESMVCAGMGGKLMMKILDEGKEKISLMKELILQPQSEIKWFREELRNKGYRIIEEDMVCEDGKYYPMMKVVPNSDGIIGDTSDEAGVGNSDIYDAYGKILLEKRHPVLKQFLDYCEENLSKVLENLEGQDGERTKQRKQELDLEIQMIRKAKAYLKQ